jgi:hypothetical protein
LSFISCFLEVFYDCCDSQFELEREKLAAELEEERKAQLERDRRIMEQQLKIDNLSTLVINSDQDRNSFKVHPDKMFLIL